MARVRVQTGPHTHAYREVPDAPAPSGITPCRFRGQPTGEVKVCGTCKGNVSLKVFGCDKFGVCLPTQEVPGISCCRTCVGRERFAPITTRHLLYHLYPTTGPGVWEWNVDELCKRLDLFNGKVIVAVGNDPPEGRGKDTVDPRTVRGCDSLETVRARFGKHADRIEFLPFVNDPTLREVEPFEALFSRLPNEPGHATLYAHAKGVTRTPSTAVRLWTQALIEICIDFWPLVERQRAQFPVTGPFKKVGAGCWVESVSDWHYSGSWFWFRNAELLSKDWRKIDRFWCGIEAYPSLHFPAADAGCLFHEGTPTTMDLFSERYWQGLEGVYRKWKEQNAALSSVRVG